MLNEANVLFSNGHLVHGKRNYPDVSITIDVYKLVTDMEYELQYGKLIASRTYRDEDSISCSNLLNFVYDVAKKQSWCQDKLSFLVFEGDCKHLIKEFTLPNIWAENK